MKKIAEMNVWFFAEKNFSEHDAAIKIMETFNSPDKTCIVSYNQNDSYYVDEDFERPRPVLNEHYFNVSEVFQSGDTELSMAYMGNSLTISLDNSDQRISFNIPDLEARRIYNILGEILAGAINRKP